MRHLSDAVVLVLVLLIPGALADGPDRIDAGDPSKALAQYLKELRTLTAEFVQTTRQDQLISEQSGRLWIERPDRFRVETSSPSVQLLVSDGQTLWSLDEDLEQVIISDLDRDLSRIPVLLFSSEIQEISAIYRISEYRDEDNRVFVLEPRSDASLFESLSLSFREGVPAGMVIHAATGQSVTITLSHSETGGRIDPERFRFSAPPGIDVIDERAGMAAGNAG